MAGAAQVPRSIVQQQEQTNLAVGYVPPTLAESAVVHLRRIQLFDDEPGSVPDVRGVWVLTGVGNPSAPAGVRGLADRGGSSRFDVLTGNLDSTGKGSVLVDEHPQAGRARCAHFAFSLPAGHHAGRVAPTLVRDLSAYMRVEGVAHDPVGRTFYVSDEDEQIQLRYVEPGAHHPS